MLANKVAVITGANKGIGKAIAENFIKNNATVWLCSRKIDKNHFNKLKKNNEIFFVEFDFSNSSEVIESAKHITKNNTKIDILVNNAGIIDTSLFLMTKIDEIKNMFDINFFEQLRFTQIIIKKMMKSENSSLINILSNSAFDVHEGRLSYSASKSAMLHASKILAKELGRFRIRVNGIAPGLTDTDMMNDNHSEEIIKQIKELTYLNKIGNVSDVSNTALFLASNLSNHITGQIIRVDGGL